MRRLIVLCLGVLVLPATALAFQPLSAGDGSLSIRNGDGVVSLRVRSGVLLGRIESGRIEIIDPDVAACDDVEYVWNHDDVDRSSIPRRGVRTTPSSAQRIQTCVFKGDDMRFRFVGTNEIRIRGAGIWLSAVGQGRGYLDGYGTAKTRDGTYVLNDDPPRSLPNDRQPIVLGSS